VIHHLQLGVWSFLASPAQGLKESTQGGGLNLPRLVDGFVEGSRSLASNVVLAFSTATAKTTNAARKGLINLGLDKLEATGQLATQQHCAPFLHMLRCWSAVQVFQESASLLAINNVYQECTPLLANGQTSSCFCTKLSSPRMLDADSTHKLIC
jgi:hypothetical protein